MKNVDEDMASALAYMTKLGMRHGCTDPVFEAADILFDMCGIFDDRDRQAHIRRANVIFSSMENLH